MSLPVEFRAGRGPPLSCLRLLCTVAAIRSPCPTLCRYTGSLFSVALHHIAHVELEWELNGDLQH